MLLKIDCSSFVLLFNFRKFNSKQDHAFTSDLNGNILSITDKTPTSQQGSDNLTRLFSYDPINRLLKATGRELIPGAVTCNGKYSKFFNPKSAIFTIFV